MALLMGIAAAAGALAGGELGAWLGAGACLPLARALMVASALATRSSKVLPQAAFASAFNWPVSETLPVEAEGPASARAWAREIPRMEAVASECELPLRSFIVPCAVITPPSTLARKSCKVALPLASE